MAEGHVARYRTGPAITPPAPRRKASRPPRSLRDRTQAGAGWDGCRLRGTRRAARADGRAQDHDACARRRHGAQTILARGPRRRQRESSEHLPDLRDRRGCGQLFIAMELLEGVPLSEHLQKGPVNVSETISIGLSMLAALSALHARGIVHRDLKPSNVFLTPHGIKLLDFGLARPAPESTQVTMQDLTRVGAVMGTPRYMAPEQVVGETISTRTDLFAAGAILFEMLAGRPAFAGRTVVEIAHSTMSEQPPALTGPPAVTAVDRVIRRALAKRPEERPTSADEIAGDLRNIQTGDPDETAAMTHAMTRLVVLPFRILRPDPETDFLAFSLPDAITTSLSGIGSLVVRSSATAARFAGEAPDFKVLAAEAGVDRVVMGTLLRSGDQIRAVAQLIEAPGGTVLTSHTVQSPLGDLFRAAGRHRAPRRRGAVAPALRWDASVLTGFAAQRPGLRAVPARERARAIVRRARPRARPLSGVPGPRSYVRACVGARWTVSPGDRQVHRRRRRQQHAGRGSVQPRARAQPAADDRAQVLREPGSGDRSGGGRGRAPRAGSDASRQRSGALRRSRARMPVLRAYDESLAATTRPSGSIRTS